MFDKIISWSINHRPHVLVLALFVVITGVWSLFTLKVDVLPDINKPTVAVFAEAEGYAPEDVERLVLAPLENAINGASGVVRMRGNAAFGLAIVSVEFDFGSDILKNRQIITERITRANLPDGITPVLGPSSSIMGEIVWAGLTDPTKQLDGMKLRTLADWTVRPALLKVPGVTDVAVMGGDVREWQILVNPIALQARGVTMEMVTMALRSSIPNRSGGIISQGSKEYAVRVIAQPNSLQELENIIINSEKGAVRLSEIATLKEGASPVRGSASVDGQEGVVLRIFKQSDAETLAVTKAIDETLKNLEPGMPKGVIIHNDLFRQEWFISSGLKNVFEALRDGTILIVIILLLFLMNFRITAITLTAIPLSILVSVILFKLMGFSVNVMTLGGLAVAIGELVDDAIVDVENVSRRLNENHGASESTEVIRKASSEVRNSIVYATVLVAIVFLPVMFLPGVEGRLLASLGFAYLSALGASLVVSLSVTPVLSYYLLGKKAQKTGSASHESKVSIKIKHWLAPKILWSIGHGKILLGVVGVMVLLSAGLFFTMGKEGLPPFNEGSATISSFLPIGSSIGYSSGFAEKMEQEIKKIPGVLRTSHITGRSANDPHERGSEASDVYVVIDPSKIDESEKIFKEIQDVLNNYPQANHFFGQPITHRVEELLSGVRAPIVIKVFGDDPKEMAATGELIKSFLDKQPGVTNSQVQKELVVPELRIYPNTTALSASGVSAGELAETLESGLLGHPLGEVKQGSARIPVVVRFDDSGRGSLQNISDLALPIPGVASLGQVADVRLEGGRNRVAHEGGKRVLAVTANYQGKNVVGAVESVKQSLSQTTVPQGQIVSFEGTYQSQKESSRRLMFMFLIGGLLIALVLYNGFRSYKLVAQILLTVPTAFIGGIVAIWISAGTVNLAHLVGFIALTGIVSRNGIMLIGRCISMIKKDGAPFSAETIQTATLERVTPVLMTSLVTALSLIPLILAAKEPGKELLAPLAVVIFGGLISSTLITLFLTPAAFYMFGKKALENKGAQDF